MEILAILNNQYVSSIISGLVASALFSFFTKYRISIKIIKEVNYIYNLIKI